ncbi:PDZ and LIM domain protein Zasp isoform X2 [Lutzomyia longipalpis]|uniref:PDZ and LIM domain protein Zasp isoform X2 n=1 Tax=Lutzomyia longipalpis TaxID=7200 RepID=UPI002483CE55|nr:PDZ and LIM domain protein Zasp isoform X2 [Lutzomyia longipalpis]
MAQLVTVRLSRSDAQPWGFRLQGGKDFGTPLVVQKVAGGSIAANAGLVAGDAVIKVNGMDVYNLRHKDAQDAVVRGGNNFEISVQRGGSTWRPTVSPAGSLPQPVLSGGSVAPVTHTSLAAKPQEVSHIGSGYNSSARPYLPSVNGDGVKSIVNKQYNTPVGMYSDETIAETLSAQAEVLAGGVLGVNFKKNERIYNSANSEVYKMLQEAENDPNDPAGESSYYWTASHAIGGQAACTSPFLSPGASHRPSHPINLQGISQQEKTSYSSASVSSYQENTKLSASTISAALTTHHGTGAGATNGAPQLGSPLSTGSNTNLSCATNFASNSCVLPQALSSCESTPKKLSPMASVGVSPIHSRQNSLGSAMSDTDINHKNVYNILKNCQSDDTPGHRRTYLETDFTDTISECDSPDEGTRMVMVGHEKMQNGTHNSEFVYKTIGGGIIRSVQAPGKGKNINYKINTNISGPKPFNISSAPLSPPSAGPKSPSIYPPPTSAAAWSQPKPPSTFEAPKPSTFGSSTLPRANVGPAAPGDLGPECGHPDEISHELASVHFSWPPSQEIATSTPTATPLYVPPPETQHVIVKPMLEKQSQSAPELSYGQREVSRVAEVAEMESGSESYTSTSATTTTSEDAAHMRMYHTQTSQPSYTIYESADSDETDYATIPHHKQSICSAEVSSFVSEARGAQYLADTLDTTCLVERMRSLTPRPPSPTPMKTGKHVEFALPTEQKTETQQESFSQESTQMQSSAVQESSMVQESREFQEVNQYQDTAHVQEVAEVAEQTTQFQPIDVPEQKPLPQGSVPNTVPQEWESAMVKALKTAPETPYNIVSVKQEAIEESCIKADASQSTATTSYQNISLPALDVLVEKPAEGTIMSSLLTTVPIKSVKFEPKATIEPVPLPEETRPYFPPPIDMTVVADDTIPGRKSLMLEALITAPDRPYSPFGHEVSYQLDDLPRPTEKMTLRTALTVAPERPFTPVIFDSNGLAHPKAVKEDKTGNSLIKGFQPQASSQISSCLTSASQDTSMQESQICQQVSQQQTSQQASQQQVCQQVSQQQVCQQASQQTSQQQVCQQVSQQHVCQQASQQQVCQQATQQQSYQQASQQICQQSSQQVCQKTSQQICQQSSKQVCQKSSQEVYHQSLSAESRSEARKLIAAVSPAFEQDGIDTVNRAADVHMAPPQIVTPVPHPRPFTPSLINKPAPIIPYYQQNLAVSEYDPQMGEIFDPHLRSPSPCLREKSPAPGPPPNPLRIQAPRLRESGQQPNLAPGTAFSCAQVKAESVYQQRPEMVECQRIGDNFRQTRTNEASLNRSLHAEKESASATQVGNTFIQKRSRVVEEFERTQSAKTIEIKTGGSGEVVSKITEDEMPPKGIVASQTRRFSQEVAPPKITFPAIIPVAPMNFPLGAAPQSSNTVAPPPGFNLKSLNAPSAFASAQSSHQNASTFAFTNAPPKIEATKPASGPVAAFKLPKPQTPPPPTNNCPGTTMSDPSPDASAGSKGGAAGVTSAPKRGRGVLNKAVGPGGRIPQCGCCNQHIRGPFITALGRIWCPDHFICVNGECRRPLADIGFVEEKGNLYCEYCFEKYIAPSCSKCGAKIKGDCLNAIGKHFHPECFTCAYCGKLFGNSPFFLEEGNPYCEADWNEMFTTKCFACGFPVEAGDRWVEALSHNYHSQCFNCTTCKKNLEGQSFFAKGGRPYCKNHAR